MLPDPDATPVLTVEEAARLFRLGRSTAYIEANRYITTDGAEGLPAIRLGGRLVCPTKLVLALLGYRDAA